MAEVPASTTRVSAHTAEHVNRRIRRQTRIRLEYFAHHPDEIDGRLAELDREWDIERVLEANAAGFGLAGLVLGATAVSGFRLLTAGVLGFLMQHAVQGWCPPIPVFRRLGVRTAAEIDTERNALRALRGDFADLKPGTGIDRILDAVERPGAEWGRPAEPVAGSSG